jgi:hypothetical protein
MASAELAAIARRRRVAHQRPAARVLDAEERRAAAARDVSAEARLDAGTSRARRPA